MLSVNFTNNHFYYILFFRQVSIYIILAEDKKVADIFWLTTSTYLPIFLYCLRKLTLTSIFFITSPFKGFSTPHRLSVPRLALPREAQGYDVNNKNSQQLDLQSICRVSALPFLSHVSSLPNWSFIQAPAVRLARQSGGFHFFFLLIPI